MKRVCEGIVKQFGGEVTDRGTKFAATHWVFYHRPSCADDMIFCPPDIKRVHFTYITECFFAVGRKDIGKFLI